MHKKKWDIRSTTQNQSCLVQCGSKPYRNWGCPLPADAGGLWFPGRLGRWGSRRDGGWGRPRGGAATASALRGRGACAIAPCLEPQPSSFTAVWPYRNGLHNLNRKGIHTITTTYTLARTVPAQHRQFKERNKEGRKIQVFVATWGSVIAVRVCVWLTTGPLLFLLSSHSCFQVGMQVALSFSRIMRSSGRSSIFCSPRSVSLFSMSRLSPEKQIRAMLHTRNCFTHSSLQKNSHASN